jgi:hypothetical protein
MFSKIKEANEVLNETSSMTFSRRPMSVINEFTKVAPGGILEGEDYDLKVRITTGLIRAGSLASALSPLLAILRTAVQLSSLNVLDFTRIYLLCT